MEVTEQQLKMQLQQKDTVISKELLEPMLHHIGSLDPVLRDDLIFSRLAEWIMSEEFSATSAERIVSFVLSQNGLFYQLTEPDDTAVFTRSFSALLLAVVLETDAAHPQLEEKTYEQISNQLLEYLSNETDFRGFVPDCGWAHSIAHIADAYDAWFKHPRCQVRNEQAAITRFIEILMTPDYVFIDEEQERVITAWLAARKRGIEDDVFLTMLEGPIEAWLDLPVTWDDAQFNVLRNTKQLLRTLYFRVKWQDKTSMLPEQIEHLLFQIHQQYQ
ncbi:DUF2785 domain-containing protein [Exiguobacterium sp. 17-1]|uniref:DUF2785 domain-containing protein n=1 Tax=Exiguobacterium sp. 17-1 TaxID=2931981 RepID=UPI001FFFD11D|nr:DUF2785 domain-containing protein [Exiguobacterium sp. 17-1]MCK2156438.1 DUF2785 domain-containing protein [Exiguobacterium sp. 17-1]